MDPRYKIIDEIINDFGLFRRTFIRRPKHIKDHIRRLKHHMVSPAQSEVLHLVAIHGPVGIKTIAEKMGVTSSAATQFVEQLVEAGLVIREVNPTDRRATRISLSTEGKGGIRKFHDIKRQHFTELLQALSVEELKTYRDLNRKIIANLNKK